MMGTSELLSHDGNLGITFSRFPGSLQVLTSTYKLNLPSKAFTSPYICIIVLTSLANTKNAHG